MPFTRGPRLTYRGSGRYATEGVTEYEGATDVITIDPGFVTDLTSVPRVFWALLPPTGAYEKAAVLHDFGCVSLAEGTSLLSSRDVDGLFRRVMRESGVGPVTRWLLWTGARWGALANPTRRPGWWRDAPAVTGITVVALAVTAGTVVVADRAVHFLLTLT